MEKIFSHVCMIISPSGTCTQTQIQVRLDLYGHFRLVIWRKEIYVYNIKWLICVPSGGRDNLGDKVFHDLHCTMEAGVEEQLRTLGLPEHLPLFQLH